MIRTIVDEVCHEIGFTCPIDGPIKVYSPIDGREIAGINAISQSPGRSADFASAGSV